MYTSLKGNIPFVWQIRYASKKRFNIKWTIIDTSANGIILTTEIVRTKKLVYKSSDISFYIDIKISIVLQTFVQFAVYGNRVVIVGILEIFFILSIATLI